MNSASIHGPPNSPAAEFAGRQADAVHHDQRNIRGVGPRVAVG